MRIAVTNFTGGEIAPTLSARYDLARYSNSLQCMENFVPNLHGAAERRPGTVFVAEVTDMADMAASTGGDSAGGGGSPVLLPFSFSAEAGQNFVLVLGQRRLRVADPRRGLLPGVDLPTPYSVDEACALSYAQVGDVVYLAHRHHPLHKLVRRGEPPDYAWELRPVVLNTSLPAPGKPTGSFSGEGQGFMLRYKVVAVDGDGKESLPSEAGEIDGKHPSDWVQGNAASLTWQAVEGAVEYNVYREEAGYFGFVGISKGLNFVDNNYQPDLSDTPREDWDPFAGGNHPGVVAFHQQRMVLAATPKTPQAFYMSRVGDFENFRKSRPLQEDDPVEYLIASGSIDAITWAASFGDLLLGTSGSEYKASGQGGAITATNISITAQSYWGSANLPPIIIGNSVMHVQRHGARVRDLFYSLEKDGYAGNDLSIMAPHLFDGQLLRQWAYQQTPGSTIWVVRGDGVLLGLTYMKEHDIWGWSRHVSAGDFCSVAAVSGGQGDEVMLVVRRRVQGRTRYFLERLAGRWQERDGVEEAFFVDCGLTWRSEKGADRVGNLEHLEGQSLAVLADGSPVEGCVVSGGGISLPYAARVVHAGLGYRSLLSPQPVEGDSQTGTTLGRKRAYGPCTLRLQASVGGKYGPGHPDSVTMFDIPFVPARWGEACPAFSGDVDFIPGGGHDTQASLWLMQDRPLPFQVVGLALTVDVVQN